MRTILVRSRLSVVAVVLAITAASAIAFSLTRSGADTTQSETPRGTVTIGPADPLASAPDGKFTSRGKMTMRVAAQPGGALVAGRFTVQDFREGSRYVWVVRIYERDTFDDQKYGNPVFEKVYSDQVFAPPLGEEASFDFEDAIAPGLPAGEYVVELSTSWIPGHMTLQEVRGLEHLYGLQAGKSSKGLDLL